MQAFIIISLRGVIISLRGVVKTPLYFRLQHMQGSARLAEVELQAAARLLPNHALAHFQLGNVYHQTGNIQRAAVEFRTAFQLDKTLTAAKNLT